LTALENSTCALKIKDNILLEQVLFKLPQIFGSGKDNKTFCNYQEPG